MPSLEDLAYAMANVMRAGGEPKTFAWSVGDATRVLNVVKGFAGEATWVLKSGEGFDAQEIWRYPTGDVQTIFTMLEEDSCSGSTQPAAVIPEELRPQPEPPHEPVAPEPVVEEALEPAELDAKVEQEEHKEEEEEEPVDEDDETSETDEGSFFADRYEIIEELGVGASGVVYKAKQRFIDRLIALKLLHPDLLANEISKKRFEQEARAASSLNHPNLILIYDFGFSKKGRPFIAMEFVEGKSLDDQLKQGELLDVVKFCKVFSQCCQALKHAHQRTVIHRDLKPSNIVISYTENNEPIAKVVDFGLAKILGRDEKEQEFTQVGRVMGSPFYMSPEQCKGATLDARTDIYSLGCVMYYALTGVQFFVGKDIMSTLYKHVHEDAPALSKTRPDLQFPEALNAIVLKALSRDLNRRYQTADELLRDIDKLAQDLDNPETAAKMAYCSSDEEPHEEGKEKVLSATELLEEANIISSESIQKARTMTGNMGGEIAAVLVANQMLEYYLLEAAKRCRDYIAAGQLNEDKAVMILRYCAASKAEFNKAVTELGWKLPS
jgi:serine/threonine protein kinase